MAFIAAGISTAGLITAGVGIAGSLASANAAKKSARDAASAEERMAYAQIEESQRQFDEFQKLLSPFVSAGTGALGQQQALLGLSGFGEQQGAIQAIENSPQMEALVRSGENAILQNASATGGLRGGNVQAALAQFRPQLLSSLIDSQYNKLGGLTSLGQNSAAGVGNAGIQTGRLVSDSLGNIGSAQAGAALASGQAQANMYGQLGSFAGKLFGGATF